MFNSYRIRIRYKVGGRWCSFDDFYSGYSLEEAITNCKINNHFEFACQEAYIDGVWKETPDDWSAIDW